MNNQAKPHYLRKNDTVRYPKRLLFLDTETLPNRLGDMEHHVMRLGITRRIDLGETPFDEILDEWKFFYTQESICNYIESEAKEKQPIWVVASNPAFDLGATGFIKHFTAEGWKLHFFAQNGMVFILTIRKGNKTIKIVALQNFLPTGIKAVGKMLGLPKLDVDVFTEDMNALTIYCFRDVEILSEGFLYYVRFVNTHDLGGFAMTKSGQAMRAFRHRFMTSKILIQGNPELSTLERSGYFGGRVECWYIGEMPKREYVQVDINSMYPTVMQKYEYPTKPKGFIQPHNLKHLGMMARNYCVTARVLLETDEPAYPSYVNGRFLYPVGRFWATLNTRGIIYALLHGHIKDVTTGVYYLKAPIFRDYINYFWDTRLKAQREGNRPEEQLVKIMMNSLYGKFAEQHPVCIEETETESDAFEIEYWYDEKTRERGTTRTMFHKTQTFVDKADTDNTFVGIASHVTEDARFLLWKLIKHCGQGNVYYCDTDSLIVTRDTYESKLIEFYGKELGQLKIETASERLVIHTLKDYEIGNKKVLKGIGKGTAPNPDGSYTVPQFLSFSSLLRLGEGSSALVRYTDKRLARTYDKGIITDTLNVIPFPVDVPEDGFVCHLVKL